MIDPRVASGLRDLPPSVMIPRERMLAAFRATFASFGFVPIETPHIERMEVLTGKGAGSEEVLRQIFEVTNKGGTPGELALRFDLTVPLARFVAKHVDELGVPFKRYAIGSVFRGERPAKGRFREFVQCDFDTIGTHSLLSDAEIAQVIHDALSAAGVPEFTITLNSRHILLDALWLGDRTWKVLRSLDKLGKIGREGVFKELASGRTPRPDAHIKFGGTTTDPEEARDLSAAGMPTGVVFPGLPDDENRNEPVGLNEDEANQILDFVEQGRGGAEVLTWAESREGHYPLMKQGIAELREIMQLLTAAGVPDRRLRIDLGLARWLDYYTGVVFETTIDGWERFGSIASGGRYDNLASLFTSRRLPGVGASIGLDRLLALMDEAGWLKGTSATAPVLVANFPGGDPPTLVRLATRLRAAGIGVEVFPDPIQVGKQLGYGSNRGHRLAVIVGPDEQGRQVFNLRDLATRQEQKAIPWADLETAVRQALAQLEGAGS
jgi:histidyl-tRNA synthetase